MMMLDIGGETASIEVNWFTPHKVRALVAAETDCTANIDYVEQSLVFQNGAGPKVMQLDYGCDHRHGGKCAKGHYAA